MNKKLMIEKYKLIYDRVQHDKMDLDEFMRWLNDIQADAYQRGLSDGIKIDEQQE